MGELVSLHSAMDRLFSDFFSSPLQEVGEVSRTWYLPVDIIDQGNSFQVKAAVPGFKPEDVEVTFHDGVLNISAQRKQESETKQGNYLRRELNIGSYARSVQLPGDIKASDIKATFENGVLTIELPKSPTAQPVKIPIGSGKWEKQLVGTGNNQK
jgi:HSP20 family protein